MQRLLSRSMKREARWCASPATRPSCPGRGRRFCSRSAGDTEAAKRAAEQIADYLAPLGFNLDFAPVADVVNPLRSDTMGLRSFSSDAGRGGR